MWRTKNERRKKKEVAKKKDQMERGWRRRKNGTDEFSAAFVEKVKVAIEREWENLSALSLPLSANVFVCTLCMCLRAYMCVCMCLCSWTGRLVAYQHF